MKMISVEFTRHYCHVYHYLLLALVYLNLAAKEWTRLYASGAWWWGELVAKISISEMYVKFNDWLPFGIKIWMEKWSVTWSMKDESSWELQLVESHHQEWTNDFWIDQWKMILLKNFIYLIVILLTFKGFFSFWRAFNICMIILKFDVEFLCTSTLLLDI